MRRAAGIALAAAVVLAPASVGASTNRPRLALTATPARVALAGSGQATVHVTNPGTSAVVVDVGRTGFSLDRLGRPRLQRAGTRTASSWLAVRPRRFMLRAGSSRSLRVTSRLPRRAEPGDHDALVLLTTRRVRGAGVATRMRLGIVVVVRAPGRIVHRLVPRTLRARRAGTTRVLELLVVNRGNVTETLDRTVVRVVLRRGAMRATPRVEARELRPRTNGILRLRYHGRLRGWVTARVHVTAERGRPSTARTFRLRL
jgi:hypothetical protein